MSPNLPRAIQEIAYEREAQEYLRSLSLEHFMEAKPQATQREITLASLALVKAQRSDFHVFNEMLVQYPRRGERKPGKVVPDNMVVLSEQPTQAKTSYNVPLEPAGPYWVMEYVSKDSERKDYEDNFEKYERELKVPYYLVFYPDIQELTLYRHNKRKYVAVPPKGNGRCAIPELEMEVGIEEGWVRYWYQGELLPLPAKLLRDLKAAQKEAAEQRRRADRANRRADEEKQRADEEKRRTDEEKQRADEEKQRADTIQARLVEMERELAALRARGGST